MTDEQSPPENPFAHLFRPPPFESISALMEADAAGSLGEEDFEGHLGWFLGRALPRSPADCVSFPEPVMVYWATSLIQHDVLNGGFAQAAYNIPEWFEPAAVGYEMLGRPLAAARIRLAAKLSENEQEVIGWLQRRRATIRAIFGHFRESALQDLDNDLYEIGWDITAARIQLAREHRQAFASLDQLVRKQ
jgi:hypothetical protein